MKREWPAGQQPIPSLTRFGLSQFVDRFPARPDDYSIEIAGDLATEAVVSDELSSLPRVEQVSDFHCVTSWSVRDVSWSGYRFSDFYEAFVEPGLGVCAGDPLVIFRTQDGFRASLPLADLLASDVLLADRLNGGPLPIAHGAPWRLVAPAHYGYKNPKHVCAIEFCSSADSYQPPALKFMDHPRARVALEERGRGIPGWLLRIVYRPLVKGTQKQFRQALNRHLGQSDD